MELSLTLDPALRVPLHRQVYEGIRSAILSGRLRPGDRLPASRVLADRLSLSRQTVTEAYEQLRAEGYLHGRQGSGTYVASDIPDGGLRAPDAARSAARDAETLSRWGRHVVEHAAVLPPLDDRAVPYDLRPHRIAAGMFPWDVWTASVERALSRSSHALSSSAPPEGHGELREAIAEHVARYRAVDCTPDQVVIVSGSQQGLNLLAQLLLDRDDRVAVEVPGYPAARLTFEARGAGIERIPVDEEGMMVDRLRGPVRMIHVTPSHQDPTGATMSLSRRLALLEVAQQQGALVFEDDYDSEFRYEGRPVESLQGLDRDGIVVYAGSFSKSVLPGLRIGFLVLPQQLTHPFIAAKRLWDSGTPMLEQAALAEFLRAGDFERHIRRMRRVYRSRRDALVHALTHAFGERARVGPRHGGLNVLVELDLPGSAEDIATWARDRGVALRAATAYYGAPPQMPTFLLGFGAVSEEQSERAVRILCQYPVG